MDVFVRTDPFNLQRFLDAQTPVIAEVKRELCAGRKKTHWMWFIFPQLKGLGSSSTAVQYAIKSRQEAAAYLSDEVLGGRLRECIQLVLDQKGTSADQIFGFPDNLKFHSSMTLFAAVASDDRNVFKNALTAFYGGEQDLRTLELLGDQAK